MMPANSKLARTLMRNARLPRLLAVSLAALFGLALAADPPKESSFGKGKAGGPLLTRAELRDCMARQERVRSQGDETVKLQAELDKVKAEVTQLGTSLKEQLAALDRTSADAVAAYNLQAQAFDKRVDDYNATTPAFNAKADALKSEREAFAKACENRRFDEKDEIAIKNGK
jgi:hypothetical protein